MKTNLNFDITKTVEEIVMQAKENQEEFIFETIRPYCEDILQMKINKKELEQILLKQQPCEDYISREAVLDGLASIAKAKAKSDAQKALMGRVMFFTEQLPPVTPQPKTGEWIDIEYFDREWTCYRPKCPFCNAEPKEYSNYCPNCGAKLKEEDPDY